MLTKTPNCEFCRHSEKVDVKSELNRICRRFPPNTILVPVRGIQGDGLAIQPAFPPVKDSDYCGEFSNG